MNVRRALNQKRGDKNKLYCLHESEVPCIAKGKAHKKYEFGSKASISVSLGSGIVAGAMSFKENVYDGRTLEAIGKQVRELTGEFPAAMIADRGYRGQRRIGKTEISIPGVERNATAYRNRKLKNRFRKRAGIEAFISRLKPDHRTARNYLKGAAGDEINVRLAGAAFNLMKRMRRYALFFGRFLLLAFFGVDSTQRSNRLEQSILPA